MKLFPKLLLSLLAAYLISIAVSAFIAIPIWNNLKPGVDVSAEASEALSIYQAGGNRALRAWLRSKRKKGRFYAHLISPNGEILPRMRRPPPRDWRQHWQQLIDKTADNSPDDVARVKLPRGAIMRVATIADSDGKHWRWLRIQPPANHPTLAGLWLRLVIGLLALSVAAWVLAKQLTKPLNSLQAVSRQLATGQLDSRANQQLTERHDEIGALANAFNDMANQLQRLLNGHKQLLSDVSHELRSPLSRLQIAVELAKERPDKTSLLERIGREGERLEAMLADVLTLAKLEQSEADKASKNLTETVDIVALIEAIVEDARFEAGKKILTIQIDSPTHCATIGNSTLLSRAFENVLRNAVTWSKNEQTIEVQIKPAAPPNNIIEVSIRDHGPGVPNDQLQRIFRPFERVSLARERETGGYGLGLAIAARAIDAHGGSIRASNAKGGGLRVQLQLPRRSLSDLR